MSSEIKSMNKWSTSPETEIIKNNQILELKNSIYEIKNKLVSLRNEADWIEENISDIKDRNLEMT